MSYYDLRICLMDTDTPFRLVSKVWAQTGEPVPKEDRDVEDPTSGERYRLEGVYFGPPLDKADLQALLGEHFDADPPGMITANVTDNGPYGDGLYLSFKVPVREGNPETHPDKWGDNMRKDTPRELFAIRLTPRQATILGEALLAAGRLRGAQES